MSSISQNGNSCQGNSTRRLTNAEFWAVQHGTLISGSEWDGWSLTDIYLFHRDTMSRDTAAAHVDSVMQNRMWALSNGFGRVADKLDLLEIPAHEWEPVAPYFVEEVTA